MNLPGENEWGTPILLNGRLQFLRIFKFLRGAPISPNFKMKEAPISPNFQNRRHFDLFFYILSRKNTVSNSNLLVQLKNASYNTFGWVF